MPSSHSGTCESAEVLRPRGEPDRAPPDLPRGAVGAQAYRGLRGQAGLGAQAQRGRPKGLWGKRQEALKPESGALEEGEDAPPPSAPACQCACARFRTEGVATASPGAIRRGPEPFPPRKRGGGRQRPGNRS